MPHFVIECSENILSTHDADYINRQVHIAANSTGLFGESAIQVRILPFMNNLVGNEKVDFIQVFASILEGRTPEQKLDLSKTVISKLAEMFPQVDQIAMDVLDLKKGVGFNKNKL